MKSIFMSLSLPPVFIKPYFQCRCLDRIDQANFPANSILLQNLQLPQDGHRHLYHTLKTDQ